MPDRCLSKDQLYGMRTLQLPESREKECFVLLIEEQAELRELHMVALELEGYRPIAVPRGSDALNWLCMVQHCLTKIFLCRSPSSFSPWKPVTLP